jgi:hypothetical protein
MIPTHLIPNGVNGVSGEYLCSPVSVAEIARAAREHGIWRPVQTRGLMDGDPRDLAETGWGVVFPQETPQAVRKALGDLLRRRRAQAGPRYRELDYLPGETRQQFLRRYSSGPGPVDPEQLPYYLLLVGSPEAIPLSFQYQLDLQYAVGRVAFEKPKDYATYARNVVAQEEQRPPRTRKVALFSTQHPDDEVTQICAEHLMGPLARRLRAKLPEGWELQSFCREAATKDQLGRLLGGRETPDLLFTASHGLAFTSGDPRQLAQQGALLCHGWPGPREGQGKPIARDYFFSGADLAAEARLQGLLSFHLACFSCGTPHLGSWPQLPGGTGKLAAPHDFLAELPQRLLAHPNGGALAVIGHVDTVWHSSLLWEGRASQIPVFEATLRPLMQGIPVGEAMKHFGERCGQIATELLEEMRGQESDDEALASLWLASQDARSYVVLGDPAVRLPGGSR